MLRRSFLLWIVLAASLGFPLYLMKYEVQAVEEELQRVNREIVRNEEAIHVLKAEWAFLNRPDKLAALTERHLELKPLDARQLADMVALNSRVQEVRAVTRDARTRDAAAPVQAAAREAGRDPAKVIRAAALTGPGPAAAGHTVPAPVAASVRSAPRPVAPEPILVAAPRSNATTPIAAPPVVVPPAVVPASGRPAVAAPASMSRPVPSARAPVALLPLPAQSIAQTSGADFSVALSLASAKAILP